MNRAFRYTVDHVVEIVRDEEPSRSGHLRAETHAEYPTPQTAEIVASALNNGFDYGEGLTTGTGIFGPHRRRIYPRTARALKTPYGPRASIAGMPANRYDLRAQARALAEAPEKFAEGLAKEGDL